MSFLCTLRVPTILLVLSVLTTACSGGQAPESPASPSPAPTPAPAPTLSLSANPMSVANGARTTLTWSTTQATTCSATGAWSGTRATSGSELSAALTQNATFTLNCSGAGGDVSRSVSITVQAGGTGSASLSWEAPAFNEDGSMLTDLAGFNIYQGSAANALQRVRSVSAGTMTHTIDALPSGTHFFAVSAFNSAGIESMRTSPVSKTIP